MRVPRLAGKLQPRLRHLAFGRSIHDCSRSTCFSVSRTLEVHLPPVARPQLPVQCLGIRRTVVEDRPACSAYRFIVAVLSLADSAILSCSNSRRGEILVGSGVLLISNDERVAGALAALFP